MSASRIDFLPFIGAFFSVVYCFRFVFVGSSVRSLEAEDGNLAVLLDFSLLYSTAPHSTTTAQLSLAWLLAQKAFIVPIPGTGKIKHLQENIESTKLVLTAEDMKEIASALAECKVHGGRMNEEQMKVVEQ